MSVDKSQSSPLKKVEEEPDKKEEEKVLVECAIALTILMCSTTYVSYDYIQNIHGLKHSDRENIQWLIKLLVYLCGVVVLLFSLLSDCAFQDYHVELGESILSSIGYVVVVTINFVHPYSNITMISSIFPLFLQIVTTPNSWAFLLRQTRFTKVDIDWVLSVTLTAYLSLVCVFKISSELVRFFVDDESLSYLFTIWQLMTSLCRVLILLMISNRVSKAEVSFGPFATVFLVTFHIIRRRFRRIFHQTKEEKQFQDVDIFYTKRFWSVVSIMFFFAPLGLGSMCVFVVSKSLEVYLLKSSISLLENFHSYYFIGGSVLAFFYFFGLAPLLKKTKFWTKELRHLGVCYVLIAIALSYIGILQSFIFAHGRMKEGYAHMRVFNLVDSVVKIESDIIVTQILPYSMFSFSEKTSRQFDWTVQVHNDEKEIHEKTTLVAYKEKWNVYTIRETGVERVDLDIELSIKSRGEPPLLFLLPTSSNATLNIKSESKISKMKPSNSTETLKLDSEGHYDIEAITSNSKKHFDYNFDEDSIYAIFVLEPISKESLKIFSLKKPRNVDIKWLIPCAAILGMTDLLEPYVCMKFIFYQGPPQLRTLAVAISYFMHHSTSFIYLIPSLDLPNFELYVFIVLSIVIMFFALFIYRAMKYIPYTFTTNGKF